MPNSEITFWEWFYEIMKLMREYLDIAWNKSLIAGFISVQETREKLLLCQPGTFLLRFCDREPGNYNLLIGIF